jgi:hypothetical protein
MRSDPAVDGYRIDHTHGLVGESLSGDRTSMTMSPSARIACTVPPPLYDCDWQPVTSSAPTACGTSMVMVSTSSKQCCQVPAVDATKSRRLASCCRAC